MSKTQSDLTDLVEIFNKMENASPELRVVFGFPATGDLLPPDDKKHSFSRARAISNVRQAIREMQPSYNPMGLVRRVD